MRARVQLASHCRGEELRLLESGQRQQGGVQGRGEVRHGRRGESSARGQVGSAKSAAAAKPAATKVSSTTTTKTVTQKNYDCSKPGNANKAVCKSAPQRPPSRSRNRPRSRPRPGIYDCTKPGNANSSSARSRHRRTAASPARRRGEAARPRHRRRTAAAAPASVEDHNPAGAIAQCKDGTYSHSKVRTGACSRHGGVAKWS